MDYETLLTEQDQGVLRITLNRPERLNAWTYRMGAELSDAVNGANENNDIIAMVITGAGRGFCAGADIQDVFKAQADGAAPARDGTPRDWVGLVRSSKPMVAAINGAAIGVGLTQVLPMDYLIASTTAKLSVRFVKMGLVPELASSHFLTLRMGFGMIKALINANASEQDLATVQRRELEALQQCYKSPEHHEAIAAFMEKREPDFRTARQRG
jgi:2-(1,2-epoxy-1,2-dihydrophenyl)acetyl-CoA isomerase